MDNEKISGSAPDSAASSMAYMPQPKGATKEDNDFKLDKKAEKKTVADLPDKLADSSVEHTGFKVMVNGKAKSATPEKTNAKAQPRATTDQSVHTMHDVKQTDHFSDEPLEQSEKNPVTPPRKRSSRTAVFFVIILLIVASGLGYLYYASRAQVTQLNTDLQQAKSDKDALKAQLSSSPQESSQVSNTTGDAVGKRSIPELGLVYALNGNTGKVTYSYSETVASDKSVHSNIRFSSTTLIAAERTALAANAENTRCTSADGPLGTLTSYKATETVPSALGSGKFADFKVDNASTFKFGNTYYVFSAAQSPCSSDKTTQAVQTADKKLVTELLATLATQ